MVTRSAILLSLLLVGCGGSGSQPELAGMLCTAPITIQAGDYTTDLEGQWLWMPDINSEVRIMEPCT